ncbi:BZ3500_MvSof-1268-A1-R1_Chr3-3g06613 [Microbotryum saponariae]|uniref:BZ3500_MvSof-1268-A1-R1_Chr3-3g06613 protein n=1 Tax=Microbotryum saponariae TaxID=289078 RepID=A0A2X0LHD2_9BASI|nr:BZ3500_MvSof-1268-A1-R1_Chr3-3g06613 [Microbotryum saponariae]SDA04580.1 BZ3501_MvSof-1269-A2-R1_Chr3-2g06300 [Microbotryum saponariae]
MQPSSPDEDRLQIRKLARKEANKAYLHELSACLDDTAQRMALDVRISFAEARAQLLADLYAENPLRPKRAVSAWNHFVSIASKTALPSQAALEDAGEASDSETEPRGLLTSPNDDRRITMFLDVNPPAAPRPKKRSLPEVSQAASKDYARMTEDQREELRKEADQTVNDAAGEAIVKRKHAKRIPEMKTIGRRLHQLSKLHGVKFILVYASYDWGEKALKDSYRFMLPRPCLCLFNGRQAWEATIEIEQESGWVIIWTLASGTRALEGWQAWLPSTHGRRLA